MAGPVPGGEFAGYEVLSLLGRGGMGSVFLVRNRHLERREALKVLAVDSQGDFAARFGAEARTVASLDHPGIVTVYHHGIDGEIPWFTMQYLEGTDLSGGQRLPLGEVTQIVRQVADALDYAHARGVVHRDVKPANIMVRRDAAGAVERVTVLDFGIARLAGASSLTAADSFVGTLTYAAPETIGGRRDVAAADQYALACTAYELLTGRTPFAGLPTPALLHAQLSEAPPPISRSIPALAGLDHVFARALAKDPAQRYRSCRAFAAALAAGADPATRRQTRVAPVPLPPPPPVGPATTPPPPNRSTITIMLSLIAILIGIAVIAGAILLINRDDSASPAPDVSSSPAGAAASPSGVSPSGAPSSAAAAATWGLVVSPQGRVIRFGHYDSREDLLSKAATYGYDESWGYATFTTGCAAVAHATGVSAGSAAYYTARGATRTAASQAAVDRSQQATGRTSSTVSTLCVGDSLD
ncbi:serine/threonine-protein kinase [Gordonia caeni]|uniref:non-specific serine/threonine protein kinase n=1 Tax=Gordonia caeni TaxID=1007097 RepID=A0ABP7P4M2_9ACTN